MSDPSGAGPAAWLRAAVKAVPATKYALGALGFGAAGAIALRLLGSASAAVIAVATMLAFAVIVLLFARLAEAKPRTFKGPAQVLLWAMTILFVLAMGALFTSFFFDVPLHLAPQKAATLQSDVAPQTQPLTTPVAPPTQTLMTPVDTAVVRDTNETAQTHVPRGATKNSARAGSSHADPNTVTGMDVSGNSQGGPAVDVQNSGGPDSVGLDIKATAKPDQNVTGLRINQTGPGTGLRVNQTGPGTGVRVNVKGSDDQTP